MKKLNSLHKSINFKNTFILIALLVFSNFLSAQIKVDSNGRIGLHTTTTSTSADVLIVGSAKIQNAYGGVISFGSYYSSPEIIPGTAGTGQIGTSSYPFSDVYAYSIRGYNLYTQYITLHASDKRLKENFRIIDQPHEKIMQMTGKKYDYIPDEFDTIGTEKERQRKTEMKKNKLGFVAQEVEKILPEAVYYEEKEDRYYIDYNAIIPVIVEAMKEQNARIETLEAEINNLKGSPNLKSASIEPNQGQEKLATLGQNFPNPFRETTRIVITLPQSVVKATLYIYNMQGVQIKSYPLNERGNTNVTIEGNSLKAGMYMYTLIADGKEVDTKKMILTK